MMFPSEACIEMKCDLLRDDQHGAMSTKQAPLCGSILEPNGYYVLARLFPRTLSSCQYTKRRVEALSASTLLFCGLDHGIASTMVWKAPSMAVPRKPTVTTMMAAIRATNRPYSTAVAPVS